jgi:hypothetical protein
VPRFGNQIEVHLDGYEATGQAKLVEQGGHGQSVGRRSRVAIDDDLHGSYFVPGPPTAGPAAARKEATSRSTIGLMPAGARCMAVDHGRL